MVEDVARVRGVDGKSRVVVRVANVRDAVLLGQSLQLAMARGNAHGADVVALGEQQLERDLPIDSSCGELVATARPSCTGVVQAGSRRATPETSTMHSRQAPTALQALHVTEGRDVLVVGPGDFEDRLACGRRDHLAVDADLHLLGHGRSPYLSAAADVAAQATGCLFQGGDGRKAERHLGVRADSLGRGHLAGHVAAAFARRLGRLHLVLEVGDQAGEALLLHQTLVDVAGRLLADSHRVRYVGGAGDEVAARVEAVAAGLERVAVHLDRAVFLHLQARCLAEVGVDLLAHGEDHAVALDADHLVGRHRPAAAGGVELAELRPDGLDRAHPAVLVADDPMRRGEVDDLRALVLGRLDLLGDGRHVLALASVDDRHVRARAGGLCAPSRSRRCRRR